MPFSILTVCTGNVCRSPQAEQLLRARFEAADIDVRTSSAGIFALVGEEMPEQAQALSREFGGDPEGHHPRRMTKQFAEDADLVLALAREHRGSVAKMMPLASRKLFTLREFARVLVGIEELAAQPLDEDATPIVLPEAGDLPGWLALAQRYRGWFGVSPQHDDVVDPFGRSDEDYRTSAEQIVSAVDTIVRVVMARPEESHGDLSSHP